MRGQMHCTEAPLNDSIEVAKVYCDWNCVEAVLVLA
jgi:hypothetical protein